MKLNKYIAKTFEALETVLEDELISLGAVNTAIIRRSVAFECDFDTMVKINLCSRVALRIYMPITSFEMKHKEDMYLNIKAIEWDKWIKMDNTFSIESILNSNFFNNSHFVALRAKDAIVDYFYAKYNQRPNVDVRDSDIRIQVHISSANVCTISFDTSGDTLFKRGYKKRMVEATINECLAAGLIYLSKWDKKSDFYDLMCGSGTIFIEAGLMATNTPPNLKRKKWPFFYLEDFNRPKYINLIEELKDQIVPFEHTIYVSDISSEAMDYAKMNYYDSGLNIEDIRFKKNDFFDIKPETKGTLILNPPYNVRMNLDDQDLWYKDLGDMLKNNYKGCNVWIISSNKNAMRKIGLKPDITYRLSNANLASEFCNYTVF